MKLIQSNIDNLTRLWRLGGEAAGSFWQNENYAISRIPNSQWPNKLWFHRDPDNQLLDEILQKWDTKGITLAIWESQLKQGEKLLRSYGFEEKSELTGMSTPLAHPPENKGRLLVQKVRERNTAARWSQLFQAAFGYQIHPETVALTLDKIDYFIGYHEGQPVGTAALYRHQPAIAGIHSMGILPEQRRKGFAEELLLHLLNTAQQQGAMYATLQASSMGKGLYLKTGFKEDFLLKNFIKQ